MILIITQCCLPSNGQKVILGSCTALMITVLLIYFIQKVTNTGNDTPWIGWFYFENLYFNGRNITEYFLVLFYSTCLYMVSISMAESIFVLIMLKTEQKQSLPWIIKRQLQGRLGKLLFLGNHVSEVISFDIRFSQL